MIYPTLRAEMARKGINAKQLAAGTGIKYGTLNNKLRGERDFTINEGMMVKEVLGVTMPLETLFAFVRK